MHDYIFHHQHTLEDSDLEQFAKAVGLDMQQFARDMAERPYVSRIEEDLQSGIRSGVRGDGRAGWGTGTLAWVTMGCLLSGRRPCDPHTTRCVVSSVQSSLQSRMHKPLFCIAL